MLASRARVSSLAYRSAVTNPGEDRHWSSLRPREEIGLPLRRKHGSAPAGRVVVGRSGDLAEADPLSPGVEYFVLFVRVHKLDRELVQIGSAHFPRPPKSGVLYHQFRLTPDILCRDRDDAPVETLVGLDANVVAREIDFCYQIRGLASRSVKAGFDVHDDTGDRVGAAAERFQPSTNEDIFKRAPARPPNRTSPKYPSKMICRP